MKYQTLYNGVQIPLLGLGTYRVDDEKRGLEAIKCAINDGYRLFDTAQVYLNEELLGQAIKESGVPREEFFVVTKLHFKAYDNPIPKLEESFKKLGLDYIDLVLLHWPFADYYNAWRVLENYYKEGRIKAIGVSNFSPAKVIDLTHFSKIKPMVNQIEANIYCQRPEEIEWFNKMGVTLMAYSPLGHGKLPDLVKEEILTRIGNRYGKTGAQVSIRFLIQLGFTVIPKSSNPGRIKENLDVFDFELTDEEMEEIKTLNKNSPLVGRPDDPNTVIKLIDRDD